MGTVYLAKCPLKARFNITGAELFHVDSNSILHIGFFSSWKICCFKIIPEPQVLVWEENFTGGNFAL